MPLKPGLYDLVITDQLQRHFAEVAPNIVADEPLSPEEAAERLSEVVARQVRAILDEVPQRTDRLKSQLELTNGLLAHLRALSTKLDLNGSVEPTVLRAIHNPVVAPPNAPDIGLATPWLFTAGKGSPALLAELRREAAACDQIDILVSFITLAGVRKLIDVLRSVTAADASGRGRTKIRVLTTTYTGATEVHALDELARLNGCEVRVSLDGRRTRLHAKAWIFHRETGFGSAYVGSANLSGAALLGGLEWTTKFTQRGQEALFNRAQAHFDTLWLDEEFTPYHPEDGEVRAALVAALDRESGGDGGMDPGVLAFFDIHPKPYQQDMIEDLAHERSQGRRRNLVVAATGTGKTIVAALDYRTTVADLKGQRPRLLFVAHRAQILRQARRAYREVLRDHSFGELLTGGVQPQSFDYLFASIDSLTSRDLVAKLGAEYWHTVVVDECHRLAADRFDRLARAVTPHHFVGLTATPERSDGQSILQYFDQRPDGSPAVELRLWDALDMQLLAPFEYYGCDDPTDFSDVPWDRPGERAAIDKVITGNDARARMIIQEWHRLVGNPRDGKALVFCVSVAHAEFMTRRLNDAGIPAMCVVGTTSKVDQLRAPRMLAEGKVAALVTVDLYNEGVDIPEVDTLLLLRPTQSPVLFQQQIGRGLRLQPGKESCLVLDFVGQHRTDFRFDRLLSGITGLTRTQLVDAVEHGFSGLPPGCHIHLERQTRAQVLRSLRALTQQTWRRLTSELQGYSAIRRPAQVRLGEFLHDQHVELSDVYRDNPVSGWTTLRRSAQVLRGSSTQGEAELSRRIGALTHLDDPEQIRLLRRVAETRGTYVAETEGERRRLQMLAYRIDTSRKPISAVQVLRRFAEAPECAGELLELAEVLEARTRLEPRATPDLEEAPLQLYGSYHLFEILAAVGYYTETKMPFMNTGVLRLPDHEMELLFVTLDKSEGFHQSVAYNDYAVSPSRFHWQTQNSVAPHTTVGRRYLESASNGWRFQLFVRVQQGTPYRVCGPVFVSDPADISGSRPMSIEWTLRAPLPPRLFGEFSVLRSQA